MTRRLSKSNLLSFLQCPKRLWLEVHRPELRDDSTAAEASYQIGTQVGAIARSIYDPDGRGTTIDAQSEGYDQALARSSDLLNSSTPIFEAGFASENAIAFADVMLPVGTSNQRAWRMIEVKSSASLKGYYLNDAAIQAHIARQAGVNLDSIAIAHIDTSWVYTGDNDYRGLLTEVDVTAETQSREDIVRSAIIDANRVTDEPTEPVRDIGVHCSQPFDCSFYAYCSSHLPKAERPVSWLPRLQKKATKDYIETKSITDLADVPDEYLTPVQQRVKACTLSGEAYFDAESARRALQSHPLPAAFLDFETVNLAVPIWKGTRPFQQIGFQFSLHRLAADGRLGHDAFLDLTGDDPSRSFAERLIISCGHDGSIFVYNRAFEASRIKELADRFADLHSPLHAIVDRLVDLHPIAVAHYYHPSQQGSWSIKAVLPAIAPDLDYGKLNGVKDGHMAMVAYQEAIAPVTSAARKEELRQQLLAYCQLDTYAMVHIWQHFAGQPVSSDQ